MRGLREALASLLFPAPCRICGEVLDTASRIPLCRSCLISLRPLEGPCCARCGRPFASSVAVERRGFRHFAIFAAAGLYDFDFARSYGAYTANMAGAIMLLKYQQVTPLAGWFAAAPAENV